MAKVGNIWKTVKGDLINMTQAWDKENNLSPQQESNLEGNYGFNSMSFFFVQCSCHVDQFIFDISLPSLQFTIIIHLSLGKLFTS